MIIMRRFLLVALISCSLLTPVCMYKAENSTVEASVNQGDLVIGGDTVYTIEGELDISGSIIVQENATLVMRNAVLNFTMSGNYQFNMTFQNPANGNPCFIAENATITTNNYYMDMSFYGNASMRANELSTDDYLYIELYMNSSAMVSNSTFGYITALDFSILNVSNSTFEGIYDDDYTNVTILNSDFYYLEPNENSEVTVANSTIGLLVVESRSTNYSITKHKPSFANYWNFQQNCSVISPLTGMAPNVTLAETQVGGWGFAAFGESNVTVSDSELWGLWGRGSSSTSVYNTSISYFLVSDDFAYWHLSNTITERLFSRENSTLWLVNSTSNEYDIEDWSQISVSWYLDIHVVDSNGTSVAYADVTATYPNSTVAESKLTDMNGWARLALMEKLMNVTGSYPIGNYTITTRYNTHEEQQSENIAGNRQITIPEFPSFLILPLFMIATLSAVIIYKRRRLSSET